MHHYGKGYYFDSMKYIWVSLLFSVLISACSESPETSTGSDISDGVYMASQEKNIVYVDSIPALAEDVNIFLMQAVDEPYYDTVYNASPLVIATGDSLRILSFPDLEVTGYIRDTLGSRQLIIPEFNDSFEYHLSGDSLMLRQAVDNTQRATYFHAIPASNGELTPSDLVSTSWTLDHPFIDFISFTSEDSCIISSYRGSDKNSYRGIGKGSWTLRNVDSRLFINLYSGDALLPGTLFQTHFLAVASPEQLSSNFYREVSSGTKPVEFSSVVWKKTNIDSENSGEFLVGTWESSDYPFATEDHSEEYDTLSNISTTFIIQGDGIYTFTTGGKLALGSSETDFTRTETGSWAYNEEGNYLTLKPDDGSSYYVALTSDNENSLSMSKVKSGYINESLKQFTVMHFTKKSGV